MDRFNLVGNLVDENDEQLLRTILGLTDEESLDILSDPEIDGDMLLSAEEVVDDAADVEILRCFFQF